MEQETARIQSPLLTAPQTTPEPPRQPDCSLGQYIREAWPVVEPATRFVPGWHIDCIVEHLEAVTRGDIRRLIINIPPRMSKSLCVAVFWPTWEWTFAPATRWLFASYALSLSIRDSLKCRRVIESPWYQSTWGTRFRLAGDQNVKSRFENTKTGYRIAVSVGSALTGEGGDRLVTDDPHNVIDGESEAMRKAALTWYDQSMSTRLNDAKTATQVVIQQRIHQQDLTGHLLEQGGWEHVNLPMEYEPIERHTSLGIYDRRQAEHDLLCPDRIGPAELSPLKRSLGTYGTAGQLQQRPSPAGGGMIKLAWFKRYHTPPAQFLRIVQSWDTANKAKELNDPWSGTTWGETKNGHYLLDRYNKRMEYPEGKRVVRSYAEKWKPSVIIIEDKSSGSSLIQDLRLETKLPIIPMEPESDKITRMSVESPTIEAGLVWLPESAPWLLEYETEVSGFPNAAHDDDVDSTSQYLKWTRSHALPLTVETVSRRDHQFSSGSW